MLNTINYYENANQTHSEIPLHDISLVTKITIILEDR